MKNCRKQVIIGCLLFCLCVCIISCEKPKPEGKVAIMGHEFLLRQDVEYSYYVDAQGNTQKTVRQNKKLAYVIDAKGKIKNIGAVDLKNVVVTGYCRSCGEEWVPGRWFVGAEKLPEQKAMISRLPAGGEADFSFKGIADILLAAGSPPPAMPDKLEVVVESFEVVDN